MATRTVRLDEEAEAALRHVREVTGLAISKALKRGLHLLQQQVEDDMSRTPYDIYRELDQGAGRSAIPSSKDTKRAVRAAVRTKLGR